PNYLCPTKYGPITHHLSLITHLSCMSKPVKILKKTVIILFILLAVLTAVVLLYVQQDKFGAKPKGERLERMKKSPNYRDEAFQNLNHTPMLSTGHSYWGIFYQAIFKSSPRKRPEALIPSVKTELKS